MQRVIIAVIASVIVGLWSAATWAGYTGPHASPPASTVGEILKNPQDDQKVTLTGRIVRQLRDEEYVFSDGTGEIEVEIDDKRWPAQPVDDKTRVEITGEVEKHKLRAPEIDVETLRVLGN